MKVHKLRIGSMFGGELKGSLCGRLNKSSRDGMNVTNKDAEVTCAFCKRRMRPTSPSSRDPKEGGGSQ